MLDPICIKKAKVGENAIPKTIIRFCKGDPILITGDVGGNIDVYRIHSNFADNLRRRRAKRHRGPEGPTDPLIIPQRVHDGGKRGKEAQRRGAPIRVWITGTDQLKAGR